MEHWFGGKEVLVTGAAGFIGSHLTDRLLTEGARVTGVDNFITGKKENLHQALAQSQFRLIDADASQPPETYWGATPQPSLIYHLASPASPPRYQHNPVATYMVNAMGTHHLCEWAGTMGARVVFTSTSEAYGDPTEHPQKESYWGNVNTIGPRACYDESKRFGEMVCHTFCDRYQVDARIVRIFNTYGPRMDPEDGRVIPALVSQALKNESLTVEGDGQQTRSFCYVDDLVEYLVRAGQTEAISDSLINIGNPDERSINDMAQLIRQITGTTAAIVHVTGRPEDIQRRQPDITRAKKLLGFEPQVALEDGLQRTIDWFRQQVNTD